MPEYRLSEKAVYDLNDIADYTFETFGERQADKYGAELLDTFARLADRPLMGKAMDELVTDLRSYPFQAHIVYYNATKYGVFIVRILHHSMDAKRHL